jgi:NADP-dependent 3-hydroxy acid dehydrogenase YdfG
VREGRPRPARVALTGAGGGIGRALARELARKGYALTLVGRRRPALEKQAGELSTAVHVAEVDLLDKDHIADWIPASEAALGGVRGRGGFGSASL